MLHHTIRHAWRAYAAGGDPTVRGTARAVAVIDLLDEVVDLTPARHVHAAPARCRPERQAEAARALCDRLYRAAAALAAFGSDAPWPPAGAEPRAWRTATVADLLRGGALTLLRPPGGHRGRR
jgi:hypothetical protein